MKTITTLLPLILLFTFTSTTQLLGAAGRAVLPEEVLDTSGKKLRAGVNYYVIQAPLPQNGTGYGLGLAGDCPVYIAAADGFAGDSLSFRPINYKKKDVVHVSTDLNIVLSGKVGCHNSDIWRISEYNATSGQWYVSTGGDVGHPGPKTVQSWFKIEKYEDYYKLVYCPSVCKSCKVPCKDIGLIVDTNVGGDMRLALSDVPYKVQFRRD